VFIPVLIVRRGSRATLLVFVVVAVGSSHSPRVRCCCRCLLFALGFPLLEGAVSSGSSSAIAGKGRRSPPVRHRSGRWPLPLASVAVAAVRGAPLAFVAIPIAGSGQSSLRSVALLVVQWKNVSQKNEVETTKNTPETQT
jgi:hypothetical protein